MDRPIDIFTQSVEREDLSSLEQLSASNLSRLRELNVDVPPEYRDILRAKIAELPFTLRHETTALNQVLNTGEIKVSAQLDESRRGVNMFPEDLEFASDRFVFFTPCIGEKRQLPRKYGSIYFEPSRLPNQAFFSFTDWQFLAEKTGIEDVTSDFYLFDDFLEAIIEKTLLRIKSGEYKDINRWDLLRLEASADIPAMPNVNEETLIDALETQLEDIELDGECRALGSVGIVGATLISSDARLTDDGSHVVYTHTEFTDSDDVEIEHTDKRIEEYTTRKGKVRKREITTIRRKQKVS